MAGEVSPAHRRTDSELRASHTDRDEVVEKLRVAAGDGRLTPEELDQRLEAALTARTYGELAALTADLPAARRRPVLRRPRRTCSSSTSGAATPPGPAGG